MCCSMLVLRTGMVAPPTNFGKRLSDVRAMRAAWKDTTEGCARSDGPSRFSAPEGGFLRARPPRRGLLIPRRMGVVDCQRRGLSQPCGRRSPRRSLLGSQARERGRALRSNQCPDDATGLRTPQRASWMFLTVGILGEAPCVSI